MIDGKWQDHLDTFPPISGMLSVTTCLTLVQYWWCIDIVGGYTASKVADAISVLNKVGLKGGVSRVKKYGIIKPL